MALMRKFVFVRIFFILMSLPAAGDLPPGPDNGGPSQGQADSPLLTNLHRYLHMAIADLASETISLAQFQDWARQKISDHHERQEVLESLQVAGCLTDNINRVLVVCSLITGNPAYPRPVQQAPAPIIMQINRPQ